MEIEADARDSSLVLLKQGAEAVSVITTRNVQLTPTLYVKFQSFSCFNGAPTL